jgi:hypothetical protein
VAKDESRAPAKARNRIKMKNSIAQAVKDLSPAYFAVVKRNLKAANYKL